MARIRICKGCSAEFEHKRRDTAGKYCSRPCSDSASKNPPPAIFTVTCEACKAPFEVQSASNARRRKTCSRKCSYELKKVYGEQHPLYTRIDLPCEVCGKIKAVKPAKVQEFRFCSRRCHGVWVQKAYPRVGSIERTMKAEFDRLGLRYQDQFIIGQFICDFAFPDSKLIVECDGIYWHDNDKQRAKDAEKESYLASQNWRIVRLNEKEIKRSPADCLEEVLALL